ncbi:MAG: hypothetical protein ACIALR_12660 [Blastopirellula sp. JB062]
MNLSALPALLCLLTCVSLAQAGGWGEPIGYAGGDCGCATAGPACGNDCGLNCANVWDGYCAEQQACGCRTKRHGRYHWYSRRPTPCGWSTGCATGKCCNQYPMCSCSGAHFDRVCESCPSCLSMFKVRGYRGGNCAAPGCTSCGQATTRIIELGQPPIEHIEVVPAATVTSPREAKRIYPSYRAMLPN